MRICGTEVAPSQWSGYMGIGGTEGASPWSGYGGLGGNGGALSQWGAGPAIAAQHAEKPMDRGEIPKLVEAALQRREEELTRVETEKRVETLWRFQAAREENDRIADLIHQY